MKSIMTYHLFLLFTLIGIISCDPEVVVNQKTIAAKVSNVDNCKTSVQSFEVDGSVRIYPISDRYDYTGKSDFETYPIESDGTFKHDLVEGNFYFEALNASGKEIIRGTFVLPDNIAASGTLILSRVDKGGFVSEMTADGTQGKVIPNAVITHIHEFTGEKFVTSSDEFGFYCIDLNPGRYQLIATHPSYKTYDTENGFNVFELGVINRTANVFMEKK